LSNRRAQQKNPNFGTTNSFSLCTVNPNTSRISLFIPKNPQDVFIGVFSAGLEEPGLMTKSGGWHRFLRKNWSVFIQNYNFLNEKGRATGFFCLSLGFFLISNFDFFYFNQPVFSKNRPVL
jgi:hypothetical protein